jgi:hypothetical protein
MKKRIRLTEDVISQDTIATATKAYANMNQVERNGWISSILKCIEDMGYGKLSRADIITGGFGIGLIISGIKLNIPELCAMGALTIGALVHFEKDVWKKIIECARNKRKGVTTMDNSTNTPTPEQTVQESRMKKTIRLTESELVKLVQRIIKEDEMGSGKGFTIAELYKKSRYTAPLPNRLVISSFKGTSIKVDGVDKTSGSINPTSKISCQGNCEIEFKDVQDFGQMTITIKGGVPKLFVTTE